jgi:hypothetical protein
LFIFDCVCESRTWRLKGLTGVCPLFPSSTLRCCELQTQMKKTKKIFVFFLFICVCCATRRVAQHHDQRSMFVICGLSGLRGPRRVMNLQKALTNMIMVSDVFQIIIALKFIGKIKSSMMKCSIYFEKSMESNFMNRK